MIPTGTAAAVFVSTYLVRKEDTFMDVNSLIVILVLLIILFTDMRNDR